MVGTLLQSRPMLAVASDGSPAVRSNKAESWRPPQARRRVG
jgi:hypothetical protein